MWCLSCLWNLKDFSYSYWLELRLLISVILFFLVFVFFQEKSLQRWELTFRMSFKFGLTVISEYFKSFKLIWIWRYQSIKWRILSMLNFILRYYKNTTLLVSTLILFCISFNEGLWKDLVIGRKEFRIRFF